MLQWIFPTWALCLPRWILRCRTPFAWALRSSFTAEWVKPASPTAVFPLPLPHPMAWRSGGSGLSKKQCQVLARQRLLNVIVVALNYQYFGRACSLDEIGRYPNSWQRSCYDRLRVLLAACGTGSEQFPLAPGRSGPELGASLFQLEQFLERPEIFGGGYREAYFQKFVDNPDLFPEEIYPQLQPYRSLDASRLKLTGTGSWDIQRFIDGELWLPFVEPKFLLHEEFPDPEDVPSFSTESYEENLKLIRLWDSRGLLEVFEEPIEEGFYSKVFNAFKSIDTDRQIGDRRYPNQRERHVVNGPSHLLPQGPQLCNFGAQRFKQQILGSITDRRDFYHQSAVTSSRAQSNLLPFKFSLHDLENLEAYKKFQQAWNPRSKYQRHVDGDQLGGVGRAARKKRPFPTHLYGGFRSLYQGDHLGVEFALQGHSGL